MYVHEDIYDEFVAKSVARTTRKMIADPFQLYSEQGPMVSVNSVVLYNLYFLM